MLSRPARPIRTVHSDDLALEVTQSLSGFTHFVIPSTVHWYTMCCVPCYQMPARVPLPNGILDLRMGTTDKKGSMCTTCNVGPARHCSPRHPTQFEPSSIKLNGMI